ncbi:MAG TPA: BrnT family toxin [Candidatus Margulisiibacteriota bacterium]|nr:BrnT family toxin [Candidatus Margulisiibacteriota bacterium]
MHTIQIVATTFDPKKDAANIRKHGISLTEGDGVLSDPLALTVEDTAAVGEQRFVTIGANVFGQLRVVVYTHRGSDQRIISVRKPEPREVRDYEKAV